MIASRQAFSHSLASRVESHVAFFRTAQAIIDIVKGMLEVHETSLGIRDRLRGSTRLRGCGGFSVARKRIAMDERMARGSALDLSQADEISPFEIAIPMFELPECRIGRTGVENIAHCEISTWSL